MPMRRLKALLPSLLLLVVYFIADTCFGAWGGLGAAIVLGGGEFVASWVKNKHYNPFSLWTTLFFILLGGIAVILDGSVFERLQTPVVEAVLCVLVGLFAYKRWDLMQAFPDAYRQGVHWGPEQQFSMQRALRALFFLLVVHTLFSFVSAFVFPPEVHAFISEPLLYLLLVLFFLTLVVKNRLLVKAASQDEWLPIVNEQGKVIGQATRRSCHAGSMFLHPVVHMHIVNKEGDMLLQQRSLKKKLLPGRWDTAVGGHVAVGEKIEDALKRETREELGIERFRARFLGSYIWETARERELVFTFLCVSHEAPRVENEEVIAVRYWTRAEIEDPANHERLTPNFLNEYHRFFSRKTD